MPKSAIWFVLLGLLFHPALAKPTRAAEPTSDALQKKLAAKLEELSALQREVDELREQVGRHQQLIVHVKVFEVDQNKPSDSEDAGEQSRLDMLMRVIARRHQPEGAASVLTGEEAKAVIRMMDALKEQNLARLVSDPTLVTVVGRPAEFHSGGEVPVGTDRDGKPVMEEVGTQFSLTSKLIAPNRVELGLIIRQAEIKTPAENDNPPQISVEEIQTSFALNSGETCVLPGRDAEPEDGGKFKRYYLVTAELLQAAPTVDRASTVRARR